MRTVKLLGIITIISFVLVSCGKRTPPIPPNAAIPLAISDLSYKISEGEVILSWRYPQKTVDGSELPKVRSFLIYRAEGPVADNCDSCPPVYQPLVKLVPTEKQPGNIVRYTDSTIRPGFHYNYLVKSYAGWQITSQASNTINFNHLGLIAPPTKPQIKVIGDRSLTISWQAPHDSFSRDLSYQVYAKQGEEENYTAVGAITKDTEFKHADLVNSQLYTYFIRAIFINGEFQTMGQKSSSIEGRPIDMTPPAPPQSLKVVEFIGGAKLLWSSDWDKDIAGFNIYHKGTGGEDWQLVGTTPAGSLFFIDKTELKPGTHYYAITAFDGAKIVNESRKTMQVRLILSKESRI